MAAETVHEILDRRRQMRLMTGSNPSWIFDAATNAGRSATLARTCVSTRLAGLGLHSEFAKIQFDVFSCKLQAPQELWDP